MRKKWAEYEIYKLIEGEDPEAWDGIFSTLKDARKRFNRAYKNPKGTKPDFCIVKTTYEVLEK